VKLWQNTEQAIRVERLASGYVKLSGSGPCEWAQPPVWPCSEEVLRAHAFPEASEGFIRSALRSIEKEAPRVE